MGKSGGAKKSNHREPSWQRLKTKDVPIASLTPYPGHARKHPSTQIRDLARSIETFGFNAPIVIDEGGKILAGHARVEAVKRLGWHSVPAVSVDDLSEPEKRAFAFGPPP